jgi:hypothetical protein
MKGMALETAFGQDGGLHAERRQALLHDRTTRQQSGEGMTDAGLVGHRFKQAHHAATFGEHRLTGFNVTTQGSP